MRRRLLDLAIVLAAVLLIPARLCDLDARASYDGELVAWQPLVRQVVSIVDKGRTDYQFHTGHPLTDSEWVFGTYQLAALGLGQVMRQYPDQRDELLPAMTRCIEVLLKPELRAQHTQQWGVDPIDALADGEGQVGYLGYLNLALSMLRQIDPETEYADLNDRITAALARRFARSDHGLMATYPRAAFPVDCCAAIGSFGLYDEATGSDHADRIAAFAASCRKRYIDPETGLFIQQVDAATGEPTDQPRASGTTLGLYFLSFADPELSAELYRGVKRTCYRREAGFGLCKESANSPLLGGTVDSGPVIMGFGLTATGFMVAGTRLHHDQDAYEALARSLTLIGAPVEEDGRRNYVNGGPIGNALLLAMFTAQPLPEEGADDA